MKVRKFRFVGEFKTEPRIGFVVVSTIDKEIEQDEIPQITEKFTQGYHDNPRSYGLVMTLTDLDKSRLK